MSALSVASCLNDAADFLLVVPPFAGVDRPSLGASIIADIARRQGVTSQVVYGNLDFAVSLGVTAYQTLCHTSTGLLIGEQIFGGCWGSRPVEDPDPGLEAGRFATQQETDAEVRRAFPEHSAPLPYVQQRALRWVDDFALTLARTGATLIGFTSVFEQTLAALSLAQRVRSLAPDKVIVMGGANVDGALAEGIARRATGVVDYIFSGEAESSFRQFVGEFTAGLHRTVREEPAIIASAEPTRELDGVPLPAYEDFFSQFAATLALTNAGRELSDKIWLPYETSRGCWWGQKHHCTFCGLNAEGMAFRSKSADRVLEDLESLHSGYARDRILMVDNIMPHRYFATLLPRLAEADKKLRIFYEQKANLSWRRMKLLCDAGVWRIQPGIEALHSKLLAHMDKGVTAPQNINCLRYARAVGLDVAWNLLVDFPGDDPDWYLATAELLPLLTHLQPPSGISPLSIDRFSPYFDRPDHYRIARLKPIPAYALAYGSDHDIRDVAYHFQGDYESATRSSPEVTQQLNSRVEEWRRAWSGDVKPLLQVFPLAGDRYLLIDTRPGARTDAQIIDSTQAAQALGGAKPTVATAEWEASQQWARDGGYAVDIDGHLVPLAIASRGCLDSFDVR